MSSIKRYMVIAFVALCCVAALFELLAVHMPVGPEAMQPVRDTRILSTIVCLLLIASSVVVFATLVKKSAGTSETLRSGEGGQINIEKDALVSVARRALRAVEGANANAVAVTVVQTKGGPVIDVAIEAVADDSCGLVTTARAMQRACKEALETFTEHPVRSVAVNYVDDRRARSDSAAKASHRDPDLADENDGVEVYDKPDGPAESWDSEDEPQANAS